MLGQLQNFLNLPEVLAIIAKPFHSEFETIKQLRLLPVNIRQQLDEVYLKCLEVCKDEDNCIEKREEQSNRLRNEGNRVFKNKLQSRDVLNACRLYTLAIFAAPPASKSLSLAYANRAIALQEFGYYRQAYDDCECARGNGYPAKLQPKLEIRQAFCALKLDDMKAADTHLNALKSIDLTLGLQKQLLLMCKEYGEIMEERLSEKVTRVRLSENNTSNIKINQDQTPRGRYMVALNEISSGDLIFQDRATSFVPVGERLVCQHCASTQLIPIPCAHCYSRVVYCSLACKSAHQTLHSYECAAYQIELFEKHGIAHLALRVSLDEIQKKIDMLKEVSTINEAWLCCTGLVPVRSEAKDQSSIQPDALSLQTHLPKYDPLDILQYAVIAELQLTYLMKHTKFFSLFDGSKINVDNWHTLVGGLIMRCCGQLISNGHVTSTLSTISCLSPNANYTIMFDANIWSRPHHIHRGQLHQFSHFEMVTAANLPLLSMCNHACLPSFDIGYSGRNIRAYANKTIAAGEELFNCYRATCRKYPLSKRQELLGESYYFTCKCKYCERSNPDADYEQFVRYRCEQSACNREFVAKFEESTWWLNGTVLNCPYCGLNQKCAWYEEFVLRMELTYSSSERSELFECFNQLNHWLLGQNKLKCFLGLELIASCFSNESNDKQPLTDDEFLKLATISKCCLDIIDALYGRISLNYLAKSTYLWDMIALGRYQVHKDEMDRYLTALRSTSDEYQTVFLNYYKDFIESSISS